MRIDSVTTRTGDTGTSALTDGSRRPKDDALFTVMGSVDETNSLLGVVRLQPLPPAVVAALPLIQNDLFDLGADLATPPGGPWEAKIPRIRPDQVARLDTWLAEGNAGIAPLTTFVLPGGSPGSAWLHLARTVVRRAERDLVACQRAEPSRTWNPEGLRYLNRLSDLCFVWARVANDGGRSDVGWTPGG